MSKRERERERAQERERERQKERERKRERDCKISNRQGFFGFFVCSFVFCIFCKTFEGSKLREIVCDMTR